MGLIVFLLCWIIGLCIYRNNHESKNEYKIPFFLPGSVDITLTLIYILLERRVFLVISVHFPLVFCVPKSQLDRWQKSASCGIIKDIGHGGRPCGSRIVLANQGVKACDDTKQQDRVASILAEADTGYTSKAPLFNPISLRWEKEHWGTRDKRCGKPRDRISKNPFCKLLLLSFISITPLY